jgi:hypothetical protein
LVAVILALPDHPSVSVPGFIDKTFGKTIPD